MYLQEILKRPEHELIKRVYEAMKSDPSPGDWSELVKKDFEALNLHIGEDLIKQMSKSDYKAVISDSIRRRSFECLHNLQKQHKKVREIEYTHSKTPQDYITSNMFDSEECSLLFNLRCQTVKDVKSNFHGMYGNDSMCELCQGCEDSQEHILECPVLENHMAWDHTIQYQYIYGSPDQQKLVTSLFSSLLELRRQLLEEGRPTGAPNTGPTVI